jgi:hypothetical protein
LTAIAVYPLIDCASEINRFSEGYPPGNLCCLAIGNLKG